MIEFELFKGAERTYVGRLAVLQMVRRTVREIGAPVQGRLIVSFHPADGPSEIGLPPLRFFCDPGFDFAVVRIVHEGAMRFERRFTMAELFGAQLSAVVQPLDPKEREWTVRLSTDAEAYSYGGRAAPEVEGVIEIDPGRLRTVPFDVTRAPSQDTEMVDPARLGIELAPERGEPGGTAPGVLLPESVHTLLTRDLPLSDSIEEGGFLLGRPRRVDGPGERYLVEVSHATPAERTGAGAMHFTFTPDSFTAVHREIGRRGLGEELVGWYHTHLFSGGGLSGTDDRLHLDTFSQPWQIAGLINVGARGRRLRFFGRAADQTMGPSPLWMTNDERGAYRRVDTSVDER